MKTVRILTKSLVFLLLLIMTLSFLYPIYFMLINSMKTRTAYATNPFLLPEGAWQINNYITMISQFKIFRLFANSFVVGTSSVVLILFFGIFASYAFSKLQFRGRQWIYIAVIATIFIPAQVTLIPMYVMFSKLNLINNFLSVILAYLAALLPDAILLMTSYFKGIPGEMIHASKIDGCSYFQTVWNVIIPMGKPAIAITIIFNFINIWNDLFTPMIFLQKMEVRTVTVALASLMGRYRGDPPFMLSGMLLSSVPAILIYIMFQKSIVKGMTMGAIK